MTAKSKRLFFIAGIASLLGIAAMLVLGALRDNIVFFYTPSEINQSDRQSGRQLRLGGLVKDDSVEIDGMQLEIDRGMTLQTRQDVQQGVGIFTAGQAYHNQIAVLNHVKVSNSSTDIAPQILATAIEHEMILIGGTQVPSILYTRSSTVAIPCPNPMHIVASPRVTSFSSILLRSVVVMRVPEQPKG